MLAGLKKRLVTAAVVVVVVLSLAFWLPMPAAVLLLLAFGVFGLVEFYALLSSGGMPCYDRVGTFCGGTLLLGTCLAYHFKTQLKFSPAEIELFIILFTAAIFLVRTFSQKENKQQLQTISGSLLGFVYIAVFLNYFIKILMEWGPGPLMLGEHTESEGRLLILLMLVTTKFADSGAYFVGSTLGRHKLCPTLSPKKTWEGFFGGLVVGCIAAVLFVYGCQSCFVKVPMTIPHAIALALVLGCAGTLGDLAESLCKRAAEVKDSGKIMHGLGGVLDAIDSLLFAAPATYLYVRLFLV